MKQFFLHCYWLLVPTRTISDAVTSGSGAGRITLMQVLREPAEGAWPWQLKSKAQFQYQSQHSPEFTCTYKQSKYSKLPEADDTEYSHTSTGEVLRMH